jgi:hypothetical protein
MGNANGARLYNIFHSYAVSGIVLFVGVMSDIDILIQVGVIWTAHIAFDRLIGYGLKYATGFKDTHLHKV